MDEHKKILEIRNSDHVRFKMKSNEIIALKNHLEFVERLKIDKKNIYYGVFYNQAMVGVVDITNIDNVKRECFWGLYIDKNTIPYISSLATYLLIERVFSYFEIEKLCLEVQTSNTSAYKLDVNFGFSVDDEYTNNDERYYLMSMSKKHWQEYKQKPLMKILKNKIDKIPYEFKEN